jgi:nitrogen regulatory protein PII
MKAVFIVYGQALTEPIENLLNKLEIRGFTRWEEVQGRGGKKGEPHYGTHAWPSKNGSILTIIDNEKVDSLLSALRRINEQAEQQGLNAFVWNVEETIS